MVLIAAWKDMEEETPRNARNSGRTLLAQAGIGRNLS